MPRVLPELEPAIVRGLCVTAAKAPVTVLLENVSIPLRFFRLVVLRILFFVMGLLEVLRFA